MLKVVYKKGKSRARDRESEEEHLVQPKRAKTSVSVRSARIDYIQQAVVDINKQQISYKDRRIEQAKNSNSAVQWWIQDFLKGGQSTPLGGSGGMLPHKIFNFRPSEVVSGAFWVENCFLRLL